MEKGSTLILRGAVIILGLIVLVLCLILLPLGIATDKVGYYRPLLIGLYLPAIPYFVALYQAMKLLRLIDKNNAFSKHSVNALEVIKNCGIVISAFFIIGMPYIFYVGDRDDAPGIILLALIFIFASAVIATFAGVLEKLLQNAIEIKKENELTV